MKVIKTADQIERRVKEMAAVLTEKFKDTEPIAICVLNSSFMFYSDIVRAINRDITCGFLGVSSYKDKKVSSGEVKVTLDLETPLEGKDVILIEDIVDSGLTMNFLIQTLKARKPRSLTTVTLLFKPKALKVKCHLDLIGFEIENEFVVGYGIDQAGLHRQLPYLGCLQEN